MGQYYIAVILGPSGERREFIRVWLNSFDYGNGSKLMEHSYLNNKFVAATEFLLSPEGPHWKSRLVWAGDYADEETEPVVEEDGETKSLKNLYHQAMEGPDAKKQAMLPTKDMSAYCYIVNHTKRVYVDTHAVVHDEYQYRIHPLPLLTAEGNGRGGGDYRGNNEAAVGSWARDVISVEKVAPEGYKYMNYDFC